MNTDELYAGLEKERGSAQNFHSSFCRHVRQAVDSDYNWMYSGNGEYEKDIYLSKNQFGFMDHYDTKKVAERINNICKDMYPITTRSNTVVLINCIGTNYEYRLHVRLMPVKQSLNSE